MGRERTYFVTVQDEEGNCLEILMSNSIRDCSPLVISNYYVMIAVNTYNFFRLPVCLRSLHKLFP